MELGGHAAGLVFPDVDVERTVAAIVAGKRRDRGQVRIALSRLYVHRDVYDQVVELMVRAVGDVAVGPLVNERSRERVEAMLADAVARGATVRAGGARRPRARLLLRADDHHRRARRRRIWTDGPSGPVLPIDPFDDVETAIAKANGTEFGLSAFLFTRDLDTALTVSDRLEAGMVGVNNLVIATAEAPAGGVKVSGFGREGGAEALADYPVTKYVNIRLQETA